MGLNKPDIIEKYLRNELSGKELAAFEESMAKDPVFSNEVQFQKDVTEGIRGFRKTELKARLDAIDVSPAWWSSVVNSTSVRVAGGVITAAIVGTGIFYFTSSEDSMVAVTQKNQEVQIDEFPSQPEKVVPETIAPLEKTYKQIIEKKATDEKIVDELPAVRHESEEQAKTELTEKDDEVAPFNPTADLPNPGDVVDQDEFNPGAGSIPSAVTGDIINSVDPIDIQIVDRKSDVIKYKYYDGILNLYGDFKEQKYEILEINSADSRKVYLFYGDQYYFLEATDKATELKEVTDPGQISELKIVRSNKTK